jgi:oligopeptide transport system permease protein
MNNTAKQLTPDLFQPALIDAGEKNRITRERVGFWKDAWRRFRSDKGAMFGLILIVVIGLFALIAPMVSHYDYMTQNLNETFQPTFTGDHYFGTDNFGRDLWVRTWYGARISLLIAFLAAFFDLTFGVTVGGISGYFGGRVDNILQRVLEVLYGIPNLIVVILMLLIFKPGIVPIALAMSVTGWVPMARVVRAQLMKLKTQEYVLAARTLGASHSRILLRHLIPNVVGPIIVSVTFTIPSAIFYEAFLSYIGLGIRVPEASLGSLVSDGYTYLQIKPYMLFWPALVLSLIMLGFNLFGNGLRDALDPRMRK